MFPLNTTARTLIELGGFKGIIISGGPNSVFEPEAPSIDPEIFTCGLPVLGICYGFQLMNKLNGGTVTREHIREDGACEIQVDTSVHLFNGLHKTETVLLTHGDSVSEATVAPDFKVMAKSGHHVAGEFIENFIHIFLKQKKTKLNNNFLILIFTNASNPSSNIRTFISKPFCRNL